MFIDNPALGTIKDIFVALDNLEKLIIALEQKNLSTKDLGKLKYNTSRSLYQLRFYCGKELDFLQSHKLSDNYSNLIFRLKQEFIPEKDDILESLFIPLTNSKLKIKKIRDLIKKVSSAKKLLEQLKEDINRGLTQKNKALTLARPQLSMGEKGCYHAVGIKQLSSVFNMGGILSPARIKKALSLDISIHGAGLKTFTGGLPTMQGFNNISVFDFYSYGRLHEYFKAKGITSKLLAAVESYGSKDHNEAVEFIQASFRDAFKHNPDLNFSKFAELNLNSFKTSRAYHHVFWISGATHNFFTVDLDGVPSFNTVILLINDTAHLFPTHHGDAAPSEALFIGKVPPKKIIGIIVPNDDHLQEMLEFAKFIGLPLYNSNGALVWPI